MLFYRAALPLSHQTLSGTAGLIRRYRASIGSVWRKLNPGQQALLGCHQPPIRATGRSAWTCATCPERNAFLQVAAS